jgi:hypothetical protein
MNLSQSLPREVEQLVYRFCEDLASPISLGVVIRVRYGEWNDLASMQVDPKHYLSADDYWRDAAAVSLLRKCQDLPTTIDRKAAAMENFWLAERECFRTNQRLLPYLYGKAFAPEDEVTYNFLLRVRRIVASLLGPCPDLLDGRFGPGATYGDKGLYTTVPDKMSSRPTLTRAAMWFLVPWTGTAWAKACANDSREATFIRGNRFTTVPKDCTKDRGIAVEPSINLFFQLAYGSAMKNRLKRVGLDLLCAQDIHRQVACEASKRGHLATIDLSNASDTVCKNLVEFLLPSSWFDVLSGLRSTHTQLPDGKWVLLEKFSSMGNGFTFELETVLFLAISMACMECVGLTPIPGENVYVFGDDIIVPTESASTVIAALKLLGFTPNGRKSFLEGEFRESCGGDYYRGVDVRPFFLKEYPREPQEFIALANGIRKMAYKGHVLDKKRFSFLRRAWFSSLDALPSHIRRLRGPEDLGDIVIHDDEERWQIRWRHSIRYIQCYRPATFKVIDWKHWKPDVVLASALYGIGDGLPKHVNGSERHAGVSGVTPRGGVTGYKVSWVPRS